MTKVVIAPFKISKAQAYSRIFWQKKCGKFKFSNYFYNCYFLIWVFAQNMSVLGCQKVQEIQITSSYIFCALDEKSAFIFLDLKHMCYEFRKSYVIGCAFCWLVSLCFGWQKRLGLVQLLLSTVCRSTWSFRRPRK